ncbi:MAG: g-D-glutamyl-meso-diaminopimelate peptidase [Solirubrobacteraceae bacterium]|jgi:peptidoglycan hydrolase-like protein with peptidoglycan-binding domain|nr:g-D-glutamyl-meso-diaminopimelate peptidase [Solirubrobacteraceae bacterium]
MAELLKRGMTGTSVRDAQSKLKKVGFDVGLVDGNFGLKMENAVKGFQTSKNFSTVDGIIGDQTWTMLNNAVGA